MGSVRRTAGHVSTRTSPIAFMGLRYRTTTIYLRNMDAILRLCFLLVPVLLLSAESQGYCDSNSDCPVLFVDDNDERYCCGSSLFSYCCDFSSYLSNAFDSDDDDLIDDDDAGMALGVLLAIIFGVIGFIVFIVILIVVCVCCCAAGSNRRTTTTHAYHSQAAPVATVTSSNMSSTAAPYYNTQQPPAYTTYNAGQGGNVTAMKY